MKKCLVLLLIVLMAFGVVGCSGGDESDSGKVLYTNIGYDPDSFDPQQSNVMESGIIVNQLYDNLYREDPNGEFVPSLAEGYTVSDDGLVYTFTLRDGITFADGTPITVEDVIYSWTRALEPSNGFEYAYQLYYIKNGAAFNAGEASADELGLKAVDDKTLEVTLESPTPYFVSLTGFITYGVVCKEFVEAQETYGVDVDSTLTSGPFVVAEHVKGQYVKLSKNENYWDKDSVNLDEIYIYCVEESSTEIQMYETGQLDMTYLNIPSADQTRLNEEGVLKTWSTANTRYIQANYDTEVLSDARVRKALEYALDLDAIATSVVFNSEAATGFIPSGMTAVDDASKPFKDTNLLEDAGNVELAKQLLAEAGYPNGEGFPDDLELLYTTDESNKAIAEAVVQMWKENLNINVKAVNLEGKVRLDRKNTGDFDFSLDGWTTDYLDPYSFLEIFETDNQYNNSHYSNSEYDDLLKVAKASSDQSERQEAMVKAEEILLEDMGVMPLYVATKSYMESDAVSGVVRSELGFMDFKWADKVTE